LAYNLLLNLIYAIKVNKYIFLGIHKTFQHKKGKNMSIRIRSQTSGSRSDLKGPDPTRSGSGYATLNYKIFTKGEKKAG
jgi:hypothetical protein